MRNPIRTILLLLLLPLVMTSPAFARVRAVGIPNGPIVYSSTVVDDVTGHPVIGAQITNGDTITTTNNAGAFSILVYAGVQTTITVSRAGYQTVQATIVAQPGTPGAPIRLQPRATVTVHLTTGQTAQIDADTAVFVYAQPLLNQASTRSGRFCENGTELDVDISQISRIIGPAVRTAGGACCNLPVLWFDIVLKNGDRHHVSLVFDCMTYDCYVGGRDHDTFQLVYFSLDSIQEVDFP
jgi:hypothetical protein